MFEDLIVIKDVEKGGAFQAEEISGNGIKGSRLESVLKWISIGVLFLGFVYVGFSLLRR